MVSRKSKHPEGRKTWKVTGLMVPSSAIAESARDYNHSECCATGDPISFAAIVDD
jgi:hypothetical protein